MQSINGQHETFQQSAAGQPSRLSVEELARAVRAADPAAIVVLPRILRRVIKQHRDLGGFAYKVPHRKSYVIDRQPLLEIADHWELGVEGHEALPERVILIARPNPRKLAAMTAEAALTRCWRLLFHARVHLALEEQAAAGKFSTPVVRRRMLQLGLTEFEEIRNVLRQEGMLLPPHEDRNVYIEFAATYLELQRFAPSFLKRYFPALEDHAAVDGVLAQDVDAEELFRATRPRGAPEPSDVAPLNDDDVFRPEATYPRASRCRPRGRRSRGIAGCCGGRSGRPRRGTWWARPSIVRGPRATRRRMRSPRHKPRSRPTSRTWSTGCARPWGCTIRTSTSGRTRCWHWQRRRRAASGRPRPGCCTTCRRRASITSATCTRWMWWSGRCRWAAGR